MQKSNIRLFESRWNDTNQEGYLLKWTEKHRNYTVVDYEQNPSLLMFTFEPRNGELRLTLVDPLDHQ